MLMAALLGLRKLVVQALIPALALHLSVMVAASLQANSTALQSLGAQHSQVLVLLTYLLQS